MKVLLTGAFGNIGTGCLRELIRQGHQARCLDLRNRRTEKVASRFKEQIEVMWGDVRDVEIVRRAVEGQDVVVHLVAIIPPESDEKPQLAQEVNVGGTRNLLEACQQSAQPPRFLFSSSFDLFGHTQKQAPPRRVTDPVVATNGYTAHKIACEEMIKSSGLEWLILRFADVPVIGSRPVHPIIFEIGLDNRIEVIHQDDAGLAIVNALKCAEAWGKVLLIGGGAQCQVYFRDYFHKIMGAMGLGPLPEEAFSEKEYCTDWLDTEESEQLLHYQRHSFDDIVEEIRRRVGFRRYLMPFIRPFVHRSILKVSPYWQR